MMYILGYLRKVFLLLLLFFLLFNTLQFKMLGSVKFIKEVPFRGNFELRPLGVAMGDVVSVTRV